MPRNPQTEIQFFNIFWDSGYRNIRYFPDADTRDAWFDARVGEVFPENLEEIPHAQPVKDGVPYTVKKNWDAMHNFNYCRWRNTGYGNTGKWHYCFITGWAYASEHSSTFSFVRDVYQDNVGKISFDDMFIERESTTQVNDLPEPCSINRTVYRGLKNFGLVSSDLWYILVYQGGLLNGLAPTDNDDLIGNSIVDGVQQPITIQLFSDTSSLIVTLASINQAGKSSNVINVYAVPKNMVTSTSETNFRFKRDEFVVERTKGNYTPLNEKVNRSPFCYGVFGDFFGNEQTFKWEDANNDGSSVTFETYGSVLPSGFRQLRIKRGAPSSLYPMTGITHSITFPIGYSVSGFSAWLAQNQANIQQMAYGTHVANVAAEAQTGLAIDLMDKTQTWGNIGSALGILGGMIGSAQSQSGQKNPSAGGFAIGAINSTMGGLQQMLIGQGIKDATQSNMIASLNNQKAVNLAQFNISKDTMMHNAHYVPNSGGVPTGGVGAMWASGQMSFWLVSAEPCTTERQALDRWFERYGYTVNRLGKPSFDFVRGHYFIKTSGATLHGDFPQNDRNALMNILDRGVTFWNKDNFDYDI